MSEQVVAIAGSGQARHGRGGSRSSTWLGITSLAFALLLLPVELVALVPLGLLGSGAVISPGFIVLVGALPLPAIIFGGRGLARIKSVGGIVCALVGLLLGVLQLCLIALAFVVALTHGDRLV